MSYITTTPNMNLPVPVVGQEAGPQYAIDVNSCFTLLDNHDHSPGKGVQITPAGININENLNFNDFAAINMDYANFEAGTSASSSIQSLSVAPVSTINELFYTDSNGTTTQVTSNGKVNAIVGSLEGESYAAGTFIWTQTQSSLPTTPANFDIGGIILRPNTANTTVGVSITPPSGLSGLQPLILPTNPTSTQAIQLSAGGVLSPIAPGTTGQVLTSNGASAPTFQTPAALAPLVPSITVLTSNGTQAGYLFTVSSANATAGATYVNNGNTFTVLSTISAGTRLFTSGTGTLSGSTLSLASGTGDATITFSLAQTLATYTTPTTQPPLYLKITMIGGGGGGAGGGNDGGPSPGGSGNLTVFGTNLLIANGGQGGYVAIGGTGGATSVNSPAVALTSLSGGSGASGQFVPSGTRASGGSGAYTPFGGSGYGGNADFGTTPESGVANSGAGGGGGGANSTFSGGGGGAGGYIVAQILSPASTYFYTIGSGGGGGAGTGGQNGASGGSGQIIVEAHFQ